MLSGQAPVPAPILVEDDATAARIAAIAARAPRVSLDVEASGLHAYRARACAVQLAWDEGRQVAVVDALSVSPAVLGELLGAAGPVKIVHDVAFDARVLGQSGCAVDRVYDTAIAARMLGRPATGLAALLDAELGVKMSKALQQHDWRIRPIDDAMMAYLSEDVRHLEALAARLWSELGDRGIEEAVIEETRYRIDCARASLAEPRDDMPYLTIKGADRLTEVELAALRAIFFVREGEAAARDVPPFRVAPPDALMALARARPTTAAGVARVRGIDASPDQEPFLAALARAIAEAPACLPESERQRIHPPRLPREEARGRREREARLMAWRREEAKRRGVDEQVLLPGHCVKDAAAASIATPDDLARVPGIGAFRIERDAGAILRALRGEGASA
ncbi:MAG: ribonuclease D [Polyangiaceae bacterium]|nr:ribonuclease D [Polyangiaceae bacterium]